MKSVLSYTSVFSLFMIWSAGPLSAADAPADHQSPVYGIQVELGVGAVVDPKYEGADDYDVSPFPVIRLEQLTLDSLSIGGERALGLSLRPSFRFIGKRKSSQVDGLTGLPGIDTAVELGMGLIYEQEHWRVFGNIRHGVTGHDGLVGELGADLIYRPDTEWTISLGPRLSFADETYTDKYFGVPAGIAGAAAYNPDGGLKSAGIEALARYQVTPAWAVEGTFGWMRLVGDAADSPITRAGDDDQFIGRIGIMRRFSFGY